jgi:hypothetical protein
MAHTPLSVGFRARIVRQGIEPRQKLVSGFRCRDKLLMGKFINNLAVSGVRVVIQENFFVRKRVQPLAGIGGQDPQRLDEYFLQQQVAQMIGDHVFCI